MTGSPPARGDNRDLWRARAEPVVLHLDAEAVFIDLGLYTLADDEHDLARARALDPTLTAAERDEAAALEEAIDELVEDDLDAYTAAYAATARQVLAELDVAVPVRVVRLGESVTAPAPEQPVVERLHDVVRARTPLPGTGQAPDWSSGTPADAARRAGATYTARVHRTRD